MSHYQLSSQSFAWMLTATMGHVMKAVVFVNAILAMKVPVVIFVSHFALLKIIVINSAQQIFAQMLTVTMEHVTLLLAFVIAILVGEVTTAVSVRDFFFVCLIITLHYRPLLRY
jgi:hypothetical protein